MYLPATEQKKAEVKETYVTTLQGNETVLLVDDEEDFRTITGRLLDELGYTVLGARSGAEALQLVREKKDEIGIVVLDMIMKGMDGTETFRKIRAIAPNMRFIICTGYSIDNSVRQLLSEKASDAIQKPIDYETLAAKIRSVLDTTSKN